LAPKGSFLFVARGECPALPTGEGKTGQKKGPGLDGPKPRRVQQAAMEAANPIMTHQYTIRKVDGQYQVFRDHKYCRAFATEADAKTFIATQTTVKRTLQTAGVTLALLGVLLVNQVAQAGGSGITPPLRQKRLICQVQRGHRVCQYVVVRSGR
jgi:hypothetical protein